ncbi:prolipoprotein diacylglyceryl transferase [Motiliproteus sp. SC1-56]|uniref:prolipoprotein diacylglyceryl transferase n=1 Tax=Motiliproteus sp. SC1-56 TaxID=2799565 RepID=UPI001A8F6C8D|nr:prolipoprotein diacylglyceryl transferase [Motiliproteus sp. SC1-56]
MLTYPAIDPVALEIGPLKVHWYGLMYLAGFAAAWLLANRRAVRPGSGWNREQVSDLIFYGALGVILGGRFGYVVFYNFDQFLADPLWLFRVWEGGMAFHGGLLGVCVGLWLFARRHGKGFFQVADFTAPLVPIGLGLGRIGNFIGGELWGRASDVPWAMVFPGSDGLARHPSQLYQFALEGVALFTILWWFSSKPRPAMAVSGLFLACYGSFRFIVEFFRQPDAHIGFIAFEWLTMGQLLSLPMIALGVFMLLAAYHRQAATEKGVKQ